MEQNIDVEHTRRYFRSFGSGRDAIHLEIDSHGSLVPGHSAVSLCLPSASRSIRTRKFNFVAPATNVIGERVSKGSDMSSASTYRYNAIVVLYIQLDTWVPCLEVLNNRSYV